MVRRSIDKDKGVNFGTNIKEKGEFRLFDMMTDPWDHSHRAEQQRPSAQINDVIIEDCP